MSQPPSPILLPSRQTERRKQSKLLSLTCDSSSALGCCPAPRGAQPQCLTYPLAVLTGSSLAPEAHSSLGLTHGSSLCGRH